MKRLVRALGPLFAFVCLGTVCAQGVIVAYLATTGRLDRDKLVTMLAVAHDLDITHKDKGRELVAEGQTSEQESLADARQQRSVIWRDLELRREAVERNLDELQLLQRALERESEHHQKIRTVFDKELRQLRQQTLAQSKKERGQILQNARPKQAKELIMLMLKAGEMAEVVTLLSIMPDGKRKDIVGTFKSEEEATQLDAILRELGKGGPETRLFDKTIDQLGTRPGDQS